MNDNWKFYCNSLFVVNQYFYVNLINDWYNINVDYWSCFIDLFHEAVSMTWFANKPNRGCKLSTWLGNEFPHIHACAVNSVWEKRNSVENGGFFEKAREYWHIYCVTRQTRKMACQLPCKLQSFVYLRCIWTKWKCRCTSVFEYTLNFDCKSCSDSVAR